LLDGADELERRGAHYGQLIDILAEDLDDAEVCPLGAILLGAGFSPKRISKIKDYSVFGDHVSPYSEYKRPRRDAKQAVELLGNYIADEVAPYSARSNGKRLYHEMPIGLGLVWTWNDCYRPSAHCAAEVMRHAAEKA
jgi:hypothetical protein